MRAGLLDKTNTAAGVWADTAYRSAANEAFIVKNGFVSHVHRKKPKGAGPCPRRSGAAMLPNQKSAHMSSMSSPSRKIEWSCAYTLRQPGPGSVAWKVMGPMPQIAITAGSMPSRLTPS